MNLALPLSPLLLRQMNLPDFPYFSISYFYQIIIHIYTLHFREILQFTSYFRRNSILIFGKWMPAKIMRNIMYIRCCNAGSMLVSTQINTISINKVLQCRQKICTLRLRTIWKSDTLTYVIKRLMCYNHTDPIVF